MLGGAVVGGADSEYTSIYRCVTDNSWACLVSAGNGRGQSAPEELERNRHCAVGHSHRLLPHYVVGHLTNSRWV